MPRPPAWLAVLLIVALALTSCDGGGDPGGTDSGSTEPPTSADLRSALLTLEDMPAGWSEIPYDPDAPDNVCPAEVAGPLGLDREPPSAGAQFAADQRQGPSFAEAVQVVPPGRGAELMPVVDDALSACDGEVYSGRTAHVSELDIPTYGDESAAYTIELGGIPIHAVYVVSDDIAIVMSTYDLTGDPVQLLKEYAPRAVDKAVDVLG